MDLPKHDAEYAELVRQLEALAGKTDATSLLTRNALQKRIADLLAARRRTDRFQCVITVTVHADGASGPGTITNIGAGGCYVKASLALKRFQQVRLEVKSAGRLPLGLSYAGEVRWVKERTGVGVAFGTLGQKEQDGLKRCLADLVREQPPQHG